MFYGCWQGRKYGGVDEIFLLRGPWTVSTFQCWCEKCSETDFSEDHPLSLVKSRRILDQPAHAREAVLNANSCMPTFPCHLGPQVTN